MVRSPARPPISAALAIALLLGVALPAAAAPPQPATLREAKHSYVLGMRSLERREFEHARRLFERATELVPEAPGPLRGLGLALARSGDCDGALAALRRYRDRLAARANSPPPTAAALAAMKRCGARERSLGAPAGGRLVISTTPPGARLWLDGRAVGVSPMTLLQVAPGEHELRTSLKGHVPLQRTVVVAAGETASLRSTLLRTAQLDVITRPANATVLLDGEERGFTPLSLEDLEPGPRLMLLKHPSLERPWKTTVALTPGGAETLLVPLASAGGLLEVHSEPPGAQVTLDDQPVGHTPLGPNLVHAGTRRVVVSLPGHALVQRQVEVAAEDPVVRLDVALKPVRLALRVRGVPADAVLYVDGERRQLEGGWLRGLRPGRHELALADEGYRVWAQRVDLAPGNHLEVEVQRAATADGARSSRRWWRLGSSAAAMTCLAGAAWLGYTGLQDSHTPSYVGAAGLGVVGVAAAVVAAQLWTEPQGPPVRRPRTEPDWQASIPYPKAAPLLVLGGRF